MYQALSESIKVGAAALEGFTLRTLADALITLNLSAAQLGTIASMIVVRGGCDIFTAREDGDHSSSVRSGLVEGRSRTVILGSGSSLACFVEGDAERLVFFPRPGQAGTVTLNVEVCDRDAASTRQATLTRGADYRYYLDGRWIQVTDSISDFVQLAFAQREDGQSPVTVRAEAFWPVVFTTSSAPQALLRAQISAAHVAALLGLSLLTIERRIGEEKLPAVHSHSKYPGICLSGVREFLAYRKQFPQGHPNLLRIEAWQQEWRQTYHAEVQAWLSGSESGSTFLTRQTGRPMPCMSQN